MKKKGKTYAQKITQKKRIELAEIVKASISHHNYLKGSYFWEGDFGNDSQRRQLCNKYSTRKSFRYDGRDYVYETDISVSRKNFYYKGLFYEDGVVKDVRIFKKILAELTEAIDAYSNVDGEEEF